MVSAIRLSSWSRRGLAMAHSIRPAQLSKQLFWYNKRYSNQSQVVEDADRAVEPDGAGRGAPEDDQTIASTMPARPLRPIEHCPMNDAWLARLEERQEALIRGVAQMNDTLGLL